MKIIKLTNPPFGTSNTRYVLFAYPDALSQKEAMAMMKDARAQGHEHARQTMAEVRGRSGGAERATMGDYDLAVFAKMVEVLTPAGFTHCDPEGMASLSMRTGE